MENDDDCLEAMLELLRILPHLEVLALPMVRSKSYTQQNSLLGSDQFFICQFMGYMALGHFTSILAYQENAMLVGE